MKTRFQLILIALVLITGIHQTKAQGTTFTYQGRLADNGQPANGTYGMVFYLCDNPTTGGQLANLGIAGVPVTNGLFTVQLDFGGGMFPGADRWLEITVKTNGAATFTTLSPRQKLTPTPYAITASNLSGALPAAQLSGQLVGAQIANGAVGASQIDTTAVQARVTGTAPAGQFITGIAANGNVTVAPDTTDWKLNGNNVTPGQFLGSTNNQAVTIKVNGYQALRLEPTGSNSVNVIGGVSVNGAAPGVIGATIAGGGAGDYYGSAFSNSIASDFGTIGGGVANEIDASSDYSIIAGGEGNQIFYNNKYTTIGGGIGNQIQTNSQSAVISGGFANLIDQDAYGAFIGSGAGNVISAGNAYSVVAGGYNNHIQAGTAGVSTIGGGIFNEISTNNSASVIAGGNSSFIEPNVSAAAIGGGFQNRIQTNANYSTIAGGLYNTNLSNARYAAIPGGYLNAATNQAFAAGTRAKAIHTGAFVWADSQNADFASTAPNQFLIRAAGGIGINTNDPSGAALSVAGTVLATTIQSANFSGNGSGLTNVDAPTLGGLAASNYWQLGGNSLIAGQFLGSVNNQAVEIRANGARALRIEPNNSGAPNLIGGSPLNSVASGVVGATISGGGATNYNTGTFFGANPTNLVSADFGTVGGGSANSIQTGANNSVIAGGFGNSIQAGASYSFIGGGNENVLQSNLAAAVIGGGDQNVIQSQASFSTIGGGGVNMILSNAYESVISGGEVNQIQANSHHSAIGGGNGNAIQTNSFASAIGGGQQNQIKTNAFYAVISGGASNSVASPFAAVGGGSRNTIKTNANYAYIAGGALNTNSAFQSYIGGGVGNYIDNGAVNSVVNGGSDNKILANAYGSVVGGGYGNTNGSPYATIPGGYYNAAMGMYSFAAGHQALAMHDGSFVWADSQNANFASTATGQFLIRAAGNVGINTNNPGATLDVNGTIRVGAGTTIFKNLQGGIAQMASGSSTVKTNFTFTFPKAFSTVPNVIISPVSGNIVPVDDTFAVTVRAVTTTSCTVNIVRVDNPSGWSQQVKINWLAWE